MHYIHQNHGRSIDRPRDSRGGFDASPHFARQIDAAFRLAPAEAVRCRTAMLLCCGNPVALPQAEVALRDLWPLDTLHTVQCPIESWGAALHAAPGATSLVQHYVMREIAQLAPTLVAILDRGDAQQMEDPAALVALLRRWGAASPLVVLRVRAHEEVEWLVIPGARLEDTG